MKQKEFTVQTEEGVSTVKLNGVSPDEKLTPKLARRAARVACGTGYNAVVTSTENYGYRLYKKTHRKLEINEAKGWSYIEYIDQNNEAYKNKENKMNAKMNQKDFEILCEATTEAAERIVEENANASVEELRQEAWWDAQNWDYENWEDNREFERPLTEDDAPWIADMIIEYIKELL
jgi:hypothetical protein